MSKEFLFELGTEELPPTSLKELSTALLNSVSVQLNETKLSFSSITPFATPRRLALLIKDLTEFTPKESVKVWGPPKKIAFDANGQATKAAEAFAKRNGIDIADLVVENDGKDDKLVYISQVGGEPVETLIGAILKKALSDLPIKKRMRWGSSRAEFVRPVHWIVMMLDTQILEVSLFDIAASNTTRGHRFHANQTFVIEHPNQYSNLLLEKGRVLADFDERRKTIKSQVEAKAGELRARAVIDDDLLDEVTALVEWPTALVGNFDRSFLTVPSEALISSMKEHQKYFHLVDESENLLPNFITISNLESLEADKVIDGNERVIRPRLADAAFFFETDKKTSLEAQRERLKSVVFQAKLGSIYDKTTRIASLASLIAKHISADTNIVVRAAELCKSDLVSNMVYEFSDMQGIAGYHYALNDGEDKAIALAIQEQYKPKFSGDSLPSTVAGTLIALSDRLDTITGIFGIGQTPSGSKDPFGLRRASLGVLRILVEKQMDIDLKELIRHSASNFADLPKAETVVNDVLEYMLERFRSWYVEEQIAPEVFQSVQAKGLTVPFDINARVYAVNNFSKLPEAQSLAAANKRVSNILAKHSGQVPNDVRGELLQDSAEKNLHCALQTIVPKVSPLFESRDYTQALSVLASLKEPVDKFFDDVMVMTDDVALRENRLSLLQQLRKLFLEVADISLLVVKG